MSLSIENLNFLSVTFPSVNLFYTRARAHAHTHTHTHTYKVEQIVTELRTNCYIYNINLKHIYIYTKKKNSKLQ